MKRFDLPLTIKEAEALYNLLTPIITSSSRQVSHAALSGYDKLHKLVVSAAGVYRGKS